MRNRVRHLASAAAALALVTAACTAGFSNANFTAAAANPTNSISTATVVAPSGLTATPSGHDVALGWNAAAGASGYPLEYAANGTSSSCSGATFSSLATGTGTSYTDTGRYTPQGTYVCYRAYGAYGSWSSPSPSAAVAAQVGVVASGVSIVKSGNTTGCSSSGANRAIDCGDQIVVTFNQAMDPATGPTSTDTVCGTSGIIYLASRSTGGNCSFGETTDAGMLAGVSTTNSARYHASYAWSSGDTVLTITIGARFSGNKNVVMGTGTQTFFPTTVTTDLKSATGAFHICDTNTGGGNCEPAASGAF